MTHVHYKFSSKLSYDTVVFDGPYITLKDLKRQIMGREKLRAGDCELQITNAQSKQEYTDDEGLISKGSSVIVRRIPISGEKPSSSSKTHSVESSDSQLHRTLGSIKAMVNLAEADVSEEDKISVMMSQSAYDSMIYKKFDTVLPANYTCYRCGNTGHHIRNCPISGHDKNFEAPPRIKKSTGIPRSFMVEVDDPNMKGAMLTNCGRYAIPAIDAEAYAIGKKEKPPFLPEEKPKLEVKEIPVPDELVCLICHDLLSDAVVIPCCGNSYCDDCIRSTLLDSEDHVCPTCSQSSVSPDTLIANKFLRQAVNNFKKERGYSQSLTRSDTSQSQHPTPKPSLVPTPPLHTVQIQPQKPHPPIYSQEDSLLHRPKVADTPPLSGPPSAATGPSPAYSTPSTSCQLKESHLEIHDKEAKTQDDLAASASPSVLVSIEEPSAAPLQLIPVVNHRTVAEQPKTVGVKQQHASLTSRHPGPSSCWDSSSSSSACPTRGWTESQQLTSYSATMPPLFPSPLFLPAHQSQSSYPPGYPHGTPIWTLPNPQGAPIPSLCSSTSTSSTPAPVLFSSEWYRHQRKKQRSPHRGSTYRRSSSRSHPKSSKSKSSCSYSRSSSRSGSRSRSRSQGRSRPRSPYTRHRDLHTHSYSSSYKRSRSPTPSSSSSPQTGRYSRSRSPPDKQKNRHQSRHQSKKSGSSSYSSRRREDSGREVGSSDTGSANYLYTQRTNQTANPELDTVRYLQWKKEYDEWCEKYFSSYVGHFHQPPLPSFMLPPPPQFGKKEQSKNHLNDNPDSHYQPQSRRTARVDSRSPSLQSSSDSRSPPSQSSSDSHSTSSQSFSDSHSSPSHTSNNSRSPPSQSPSDGLSTPSEDRAELRECQEKCSPLPVTLRKSREDLKERSKDDRQVNMKPVEDLSTLKCDQRRIKKHEEERREESSFPDAAGSTGYGREDERGHGTGPNVCRDDTTVQSKTSDSEILKSIQPSLKPNKSLDKDCERKSREQRDLEAEKGWRRSKDSDLRQNVEKRQKVKPSEEADRHRKPGGRKASDTESEKNRKRKGEAIETNEIYKSDSPNPFDRKKPFEKKKERKTEPLTERNIWEGGMNVKPLKKISININLDGKMKEKPEKEELSYSESVAGKARGETENTGNGEEKLIRGDTEAEKESSRGKKCVFEEKIKPGELEAREIWEKGSFTGDQGEMWGKFPGEEDNTRKKNVGRGEEDFDLWHCALRGLEEEESKTQWEEERMEVSKGQEVARDKWRSMMGKEEEKEGVCNENQGRYKGVTERQNELIQVPDSKWEKEESQEGATTAQDRLPVAMPPPLLVPTIQETEGENELKRQRSVESERDRARALQTGREKEKYNSVAPSSGKDRTDSTLGTDRARDRWLESQRDRERDRHRQRESKTSKERRDEERWRDKDRERGHSKMASSERWNLPSSSHCSSSSMSHDTERQDRQRGGDQGSDKNSFCHNRKSSGGGRMERSALSRAATLPDQSAHKTYRDMLLDSRCKNYPHDYYNHHDPSWNYRPAGVHHSPSPHSHSQGKDRDPLPKSSSPGWELTVNNQNKSKEEKGEWKQNVVEVIKESKEERETREMQAEREGGNRWKGGRELEEGERSSSRSSSGSQKSTDDVRREKKKKQKKEKKRRATPELLEEGELKIHKKSKKNRMRADEESGGEVDDRRKEEEDHAQPSSVLLS